ncbi:hypothetical protein AAKU58_002175, partial [Oxalobacteraceae bacterium GrIS 1.18]
TSQNKKPFQSLNQQTVVARNFYRASGFVPGHTRGSQDQNPTGSYPA